MAGFNAIRDAVNLTRATELKKGSWVSLSSTLPGFVLWPALIPRREEQYAKSVDFSLSTDEVGKVTDLTGFFVGIGTPIQPTANPSTYRATVRLAKGRETTTYAEDEDELQGTSEERLADIVVLRKAEQLDLPLLTKQELSLCREPAGDPPTTTEQEVYGLPYWFPHTASSSADISLYGGTDPVNFAGGAAGVTVAEVDRWAHAVGGFQKVSQSDLFDKLTRFHTRVNHYVPAGVNAIDSATPERCILVQEPVQTVWGRLQQVSNDQPGRDLGMWRDAIAFGSTPVKWLPAMSEPESPTTPTGYGLLYDLDLTTLRLLIHSGFNFSLQMREPADQPDVIWLFREGYYQMVCVRRNRNLVLYTDTASLISKAS
jgi:hypothetical protein